MRAAPIGAFGAMAYTIGHFGLDSIKPLASLMMSVYITMFLFVFVALNIICKLYGFSLWNYLRFIKDELLIVLGTSSSESVLPRMMDKMERYGCSKSVVGLVIPTGYSFNLDGTSIYLSMATVFWHRCLGRPQHRPANYDYPRSDADIEGSSRCDGERIYRPCINAVSASGHSAGGSCTPAWCRPFHE